MNKMHSVIVKLTMKLYNISIISTEFISTE